MMKLSLNQIKTLQHIVQKGLPVTKVLSKWMEDFHAEESIGSIHGKKIVFSYEDVLKVEAFLLHNDYPLDFDPNVLKSRSDTSAVFKDEKRANAVTRERLFIAFPKRYFCSEGEFLPVGRGMDFTFDELNQLNPSQIVLLENLEIFLKAGQYKPLLDLLHEDSVFIFRGSKGFYSAEGTVEYFQSFARERIGFFDFDPAGICLIGHNFIDSIILPDLDLTGLEWKEYSSEESFAKQLHSYDRRLRKIASNLGDVRTEHAMNIHRNRIGITQERMFSAELSLIKINLK